MAFSTQKDFFQSMLMFQPHVSECHQSCGKMKTYESSVNIFSWAKDSKKQSNYLLDLVKSSSEETAAHDAGCCVQPTNFMEKFLTAAGFRNSSNQTFSNTEDILVEKQNLEHELQMVKRQLKISEEDRQKMRNIFAEQCRMCKTSEFHEKIKKVIASTEIEAIAEEDLINFCTETEELREAFQLLQAENNYLRGQNEAIEECIDSEQFELETSTDVTYLQNQLNILRKQVSSLRKNENERLWEMDYLNNSLDSKQNTEKSETNTEERKSLINKNFDVRQFELSHQVTDNNIEKEMELEEENNDKLSHTPLEVVFHDKCQTKRAEYFQTAAQCLGNELTLRNLGFRNYKYMDIPKSTDELQCPSILQNDEATSTGNLQFMDLPYANHSLTSRICNRFEAKVLSLTEENKRLSCKIEILRERIAQLENDINENISETYNIGKNIETSMHRINELSKVDMKKPKQRKVQFNQHI